PFDFSRRGAILLLVNHGRESLEQIAPLFLPQLLLLEDFPGVMIYQRTRKELLLARESGIQIRSERAMIVARIEREAERRRIGAQGPRYCVCFELLVRK